MGLFDFLKGKPARNVLPAEALVPWVHRKSHFELLNLHGKKTQRPPLAHVPLNPALGFCLAVLSDRGPIPLHQEQLREMGLGLKDAVPVALRNAQRHVGSAQVLGEGLVAFQVEAEMAGSALLFLKALAARLPLKGRPVAMFPHGNLVLVAGEEDEDALRLMARLAVEGFEGSSEFRTLVAVTPGTEAPVEVWLPPPGHPMRARFQHLAGRTAALEWRTAVGILELEEQGALAHLGNTGEDGALTATWMRGANVLVPNVVQRLVLLDTPDAPHARVEVDNALFCRLMPWCVEPMDTQGFGMVPNAPDGAAPELWRTRGSIFPSPRMRAWLVAAAAHPGHEPREVAAAELLALWDAGEPILVTATGAATAELTAPDGRTATLPHAQVAARVASLPREDQAHYLTGQLTDLLLSGGSAQQMARLGKEVAEHSSAAVEARTPLMYSTRVDGDGEEPAAGQSAEFAQGLRNTAAYFPVLRPADYAATSKRSVEGMASVIAPQATGVDMPAAVGWAFQDGMEVNVVLDAERTMVAFNDNNLPEEFHAMARNTAMLNLRAATVSPLQEVARGLFSADWRDDYAASRVLLPELLAGYPVKGETLVFIPRVSALWVTGTDDEEALQKLPELLDELLESSSGQSPYAWREFLTAKPYVLRGGKLARWEVPEGHAALAVVAAMEERVQALRQATAKDAFEHARQGALRQRGGA